MEEVQPELVYRPSEVVTKFIGLDLDVTEAKVDPNQPKPKYVLFATPRDKETQVITSTPNVSYFQCHHLLQLSYYIILYQLYHTGLHHQLQLSFSYILLIT